MRCMSCVCLQVQGGLISSLRNNEYCSHVCIFFAQEKAEVAKAVSKATDRNAVSMYIDIKFV